MIDLQKARFTKTDSSIADFILKNFNAAAMCTSSELAHKLKISQSAVIKFCKKLGFTGYQEFRIQMAMDGNSRGPNLGYAWLNLEDSSETLIDGFFQNLQLTLEYSRRCLYEKKLQDIADTLMAASRILITGEGTSLLAVQDLDIKLSKLGFSCKFIEGTQLRQMFLAVMNKEDMVIAVSDSGNTREIVRLFSMAQKLDIPRLLITANNRSEAAALATHVLSTVNTEGEMRISAISSTLSQLIVVDLLFLMIIKRDYPRFQKYIEKYHEIRSFASKTGGGNL